MHKKTTAKEILKDMDGSLDAFVAKLKTEVSTRALPDKKKTDKV